MYNSKNRVPQRDYLHMTGDMGDGPVILSLRSLDLNVYGSYLILISTPFCWSKFAAGNCQASSIRLLYFNGN